MFCTGVVDSDCVVGGVCGEVCNVIHLIYETKSRPRIVSIPVSQDLGDDHASSIGTEMKLLPGALAATTMLDNGPLTFADNGESCAVNDEIKTGE